MPAHYTGLHPAEGDPRVWVVEVATARNVVAYTGPTALWNAEKWIDGMLEADVLAGKYGIDYAEWRGCCRTYIHPEADCEHS